MTHHHLIPSPRHHRPIMVDITWPENTQRPPVIVFAHGFKGFKDWGAWNLIAKHFAEAGFAFLKFNFSHNGVTPEQPVDFVDLEAYGNNNYAIELDDYQTLLEWMAQQPFDWDLSKLTLIGHSRGAGTSLLVGAQNDAVKAVVSWAGVSNLGFLINERTIPKFEQDGVFFVPNSRTGVQMPIYRQFYDDYLKNADRYSLEKNLSGWHKPLLICQGTADPAVSVEAANDLNRFSGGNAEVFILEGADHVFGASHPYTKDELPKDTLLLVEKTLAFCGTV